MNKNTRVLLTLPAAFALACGAFAKPPAASDGTEKAQNLFSPAAVYSPAAPEQAGAQASVDELAERQWKFYKTESVSASAEISAALLDDMSSWLAVNGERPNADAVLLLKAELQIRNGDYKSGLITLLRHLYEYPESNVNFNAKSLFVTTADKKLDRKLKAALTEVSKAEGLASAKADRLASFIEKTAAAPGAAEEFYKPLAAEFAAFSAKYPHYAGADALAISLGDLYAAQGFYKAAILEYEKLPVVYPESELKAKAKRSVGDVYSGKLRENDKAIEAYQYVVNHYSDSGEAGVSYQQMARLSEIQKQYDLAVEVYEKIVKLYEGKDTAAEALRSEARVLRENLKKPQEAIDTLARIADSFKGDKAVFSLNLAAQIARKDLRDFEQEVKIYDRIITEYPDHPDTPATLFESAKVCEKDLLNPDKAVQLYQQVIDRYPGNSIVKQAESRIKSLTKR